MANAYKDENDVSTLIASSNVDGKTPVRLFADPITHRLLVDTTGGSSGITIVTTASTVDDSNTSFVFTSTPTVVVVNGATYRNGSTIGGIVICTISGVNVTLGFPVGTGGDIYAMK